MKAVLVIELDDEWLDRINTTYDEMFADITIYKKESLENQCDYSQRLYRCWCPLKEMPSKADLDYYKGHFYEKPIPREFSVGAFNYIRAKARNEVIDEILGEKIDE